MGALAVSRYLRRQVTPHRFLVALAAFCLAQAALLHLHNQLHARTGGLVVLDLRPEGYAAPDVPAYLDACGAEGRRIYLLLEALDVGLYMWTYAYLLSAMLSMAGAVAPIEALKCLNILPWLAALVDACENAQIMAMLLAYPSSLTASLAASTAAASSAKWVLLYACACCVGGAGCYCLAVAAGMAGAGRRQQQGGRTADAGAESAGSGSSRQRRKQR